MPSVGIDIWACVFILSAITTLSRINNTDALECFVGNCSSTTQACLYGFGRFAINCTDPDHVCVKYVSVHHKTSSRDKRSRLSGSRGVTLERGCQSRSLMPKALPQQTLEDKHFCEDLGVRGTLDAVLDGTRCWCWDKDRCNGSLNLEIPFYAVIFRALSVLVASQHLILYQKINIYIK